MKKSWIVLAIIALVIFLGIVRPPSPAVPVAGSEHGEHGAKAAPPLPKHSPQDGKAPVESGKGILAAAPSVERTVTKRAVKPILAGPGAGPTPVHALKYVIDDGVAVVQGDIVAGVPIDDHGATSGLVLAPTVVPWKTADIPVFVQANLSHPERVRQALELFADTAVRFVPYTDQEDVLVFEEGAGICKSYVGRVGGKQPVWVGPGCEATEVAHEIMHALGFVHEQNRSDRDEFIEIYPENIEDQYLYNFDKLPEETMKLSKLSSFDYESIMIYPTSMFAKGGRQTMRSKTATSIVPGAGLSVKDKERLQKYFGNL